MRLDCVTNLTGRVLVFAALLSFSVITQPNKYQKLRKRGSLLSEK